MYTWNVHYITYKAQLSSKSRHTEAVFHLNNRLNKRNLNTFNRIFISNTPVLALKISKRGMGVYFGTPCYGHGYTLNCLFVYLGIPGTRPLFMRKHTRFQEFSSGGGGGGVPGQSDKKSSDNVFFLVLSLFYRSQMVNLKEIYHFSRFQKGSNILQGRGVQLFPGGGGGVQLRIPYRNPYNL